MIKSVFKVLLMWPVYAIILVYGMLYYIVKGTNVLGRLFLVGTIAVFVHSIVTHSAFWIVFLGFIVVISLFFSVSSFRNDKRKDTEQGGSNQDKRSSNTGKIVNDIISFVDLSPVEAKRKYYSMMKKYHPDNGGSEDLTKMTTAAYEEYKKSH